MRCAGTQSGARTSSSTARLYGWKNLAFVQEDPDFARVRDTEEVKRVLDQESGPEWKAPRGLAGARGADLFPSVLPV